MYIYIYIKHISRKVQATGRESLRLCKTGRRCEYESMQADTQINAKHAKCATHAQHAKYAKYVKRKKRAKQKEQAKRAKHANHVDMGGMQVG